MTDSPVTLVALAVRTLETIRTATVNLNVQNDFSSSTMSDFKRTIVHRVRPMYYQERSQVVIHNVESFKPSTLNLEVHPMANRFDKVALNDSFAQKG